MKQEVLIIDDNFDIRKLISNILKEKNYEVREPGGSKNSEIIRKLI